MEKIRVEQHGFAGILWIMGWLFSIGFLDLALEQGIFAIVIWPY